jgi:hypothetical protein
MQVVRYWRAAMRHEEALGARPQAASPRRGPSRPVDVREPGRGQTYFKLPLDGDVRDFLAQRSDALQLPLDAERTAVLEHWLDGAYRRAYRASRGLDDDAAETWLAGFPVVHAPRNGTLATLLRFPIDDLAWRRGGAEWSAPTWQQRRKAGHIEGPDAVVVRRPLLPDEADADADEVEAALPYALDMHLLTAGLGIVEEHVDVFVDALRRREALEPDEMCAAVVALLHGAPPEDAAAVEAGGGGDRIAELVRAIAARLEGHGTERASVYPVGLVYDGRQSFATWHLQRDLAALQRIGLPRGRRAPVSGYLRGSAERRGADVAPLTGQRTARLTADQRVVAERFLGGGLVAAQGPPGTGKTELILNLAAATLVERIAAMADGHGSAMSADPLLVVVSTNNRAVDNVVDPLADEGGLPLALRVGNRDVTRSRTARVLTDCAQWLRDRAAPPEGALDTALDAFRAARERLDVLEGPLWAHRRAEAARASLRARLDALPSDPPLPAPVGALRAALGRALPRLTRVRGRLLKLSVESEDATSGRPERLARRWANARESVLEPLLEAVAEVDHPAVASLRDLGLPRDAADDRAAEWERDDWTDAIEEALARLDEAEGPLKDLQAAAERAATRVGLEAELAELTPAGAVAPERPDEADEAAVVVYRRALEVRLTWALVHRAELVDALLGAADQLGERGSLRALAEGHPGAETALRRLFPVFGCTLLSLGNAWPPDPGVFDRLVIDEAGQCHPAYAMAGLMRARRALVIGDVHQLEPVYGLDGVEESRVRARLTPDGAEAALDPALLGPYRTSADARASAQRLADAACGGPLPLRDHFRCQPEIVAISDHLCGYDLRVRTAPGGDVQVPWLTAPVMGIDVRGGQSAWGGSWCNDAELDAVEDVLHRLSMQGVTWGQIAVITPYRAQVEMLRRRLRARRVPFVDGDRSAPAEPDGPALFGPTGEIALGTVHRFQGGERPVVLFSTVVTRSSSLRFLNDRVNLVNVAVTRARDHLVTIGHADMLRQGRFTRLLVERATALAS